MEYWPKAPAPLSPNPVFIFFVSDKKTPDRFRPGANIKKRHGPYSPAHGVGNSVLIILSAVDRRRDWLHGGGRCITEKF